MAVATHCFTSPCHDRIRFVSGVTRSCYGSFLRKKINGTILVKILPPIRNIDVRTNGRPSRPFSRFRSRISKGVFDIGSLTTRNALKELSTPLLLKLLGVLAAAFLIVPSADAVDSLKTFSCLLKGCRIEFAKCISNPSCVANLACLETCNNRPGEPECEIKCGDLFENNVVDEFNKCVVTRRKCVSKKHDLEEFLVPDPSVLVKNFNIRDFSGKWYITSGLNPTFDIFDCQLHEFHIEDNNQLVGNISWRIKTPDNGFFTRSAIQKFKQDPNQPAILYNHDNEYLHYQDEWYILSSQIENKPDDYIFVYYRGRNDAWDGYGGAVVYTRSAVLPNSIVPELEKAAKSIGRDFNTFIRTDNTCGPQPTLEEKLDLSISSSLNILTKISSSLFHVK